MLFYLQVRMGNGSDDCHLFENAIEDISVS